MTRHPALLQSRDLYIGRTADDEVLVASRDITEDAYDLTVYTFGGTVEFNVDSGAGITLPGADGQLPAPTSQYQIGREGNQLYIADFDLVTGHGATVDWDHYGPSHYLGEHPRAGETVVAYEAGSNFVENDYYWNTVYHTFRVYLTTGITGWFNYGSPLGWIGRFPGENQATASIAEHTAASITARPPIAEWHGEIWTVDPATFVAPTADYIELHWFPAFQQREHRVSYWYGFGATTRWPGTFPYSVAVQATGDTGWLMRFAGGDADEDYYGGIGNIFVAAADVSSDIDGGHGPDPATTEGIAFKLPVGTYEISCKGAYNTAGSGGTVIQLCVIKSGEDDIILEEDNFIDVNLRRYARHCF